LTELGFLFEVLLNFSTSSKLSKFLSEFIFYITFLRSFVLTVFDSV